MNVLEINEIGKFIRKVRKERGLRLEDLSDNHISTATISNIERGVPHVNKDKVLYLMGKLDLDLSEIPQMMDKESENLESMQLKFTAIETMIKVGKVARALTLLSGIPESMFSRHQATVHLLKGKCYIQKGDWKKAERELSEAIRLAQQDPSSQKTNLEASIYDQLAYCRSAQSNWEQALKFVERGLEVLREDADRFNQIKYNLKMKQVVYLEKLGRVDEALKSLDDLWGSIPHIQDKDVVLNLYALRADLFRRMRLHRDSVRYAREGIRLAVNSRYFNEMFKLWTTLGSVYTELSNFDDAETCFEFVLELEDQISDRHELLRAYCSLGRLYLLQGKTDQSREILEQAIKWGKSLKDHWQLNVALLLMGRLLKKTGNLSEAIKYLLQAVLVAEERQFYQNVWLGYYELADCYEQLGKVEEFREATELMYQAQRHLNCEESLFSSW
ncbi:helix-turn-helix domain-containing protein [Paenactinomyces guangxiensis]|uniref:Helix-turn-helix transcriptional regulator n=1 Tax=Paenactinomyces guangxiensis TaxID=1490290 RepID=A0A7W2A876_9BACL|nr:tetratricopeptide repeat protein [Paenactinomyces guangxiensis]MBA4493879.1 helix-turn-helix transcriptional regulator [Paenactinomyces guangxiensis]MBH8591345.1 helix-turn-helix transcriptional regulator [Paenactinomyces guangxiensis]